MPFVRVAKNNAYFERYQTRYRRCALARPTTRRAAAWCSLSGRLFAGSLLLISPSLWHVAAACSRASAVFWVLKAERILSRVEHTPMQAAGSVIYNGGSFR